MGKQTKLGNNPPQATTPSSNKSGLYSTFGEAVEELSPGGVGNFNFDDIYFPNGRPSEAGYEATIKEAAEGKTITGFDYDYNYNGGQSKWGSDLHENQAQNQGQWNKAASGVGRVLGEFALNVAETPGVILGAIGAAVTGEADYMTQNPWVNLIESAKEGLQDAIPVYQKRAVQEGNVWDKMSSVDWWAVDGASGIAFMAAALVPGLAVGKAAKAMTLAKTMGKGGKWTRKAIQGLDKTAVRWGAAAEESLAVTGQAAQHGMQIANTTLVNTTYEAGVEARGAQLAYEDLVTKEYRSNKISYEKYEELMANSGNVAARTFGWNSLLLLVPNLIMSKQILGPRGLSRSIKGATQRNAANRLEAATVKPFEAGTTGFSGTFPKAAGIIHGAKNSAGLQKLGNFGKTFGNNLVREGLVEEGGQGAIEQYETEGRLEEEMHGERKDNFVETYKKFLGTADGQAAVLLGGILGTVPGAYSARKERKAHETAVDGYITSLNAATDYYDATKGNTWKTQEGNPEELMLDENGEPIPDLEKAAQMKEAIDRIKMFDEAIASEIEKGNFVQAKLLAARMQAMHLAPFINQGAEGMEAYREMLVANPSTASIVENHNTETGESITIEQYADQEVEKAKVLKKEAFEYRREHSTPITYAIQKQMGLTAAEVKEADPMRDAFNAIEEGNFRELTYASKAVQEDLDEQTKIAKRAREQSEPTVAREANGKIAELNKYKEGLNERLAELKDVEKREARWKESYLRGKKVKDINSGKVVAYLDTLINGIRGARTEEEIAELVDAALKEGLILSSVDFDMLKYNDEATGKVITGRAALEAMAESDDIMEAFGAFKILNANQHESTNELLNEAQANVNRIYSGATEILRTLQTASLKASEEHDSQLTKMQEIEEKFTRTANSLSTMLATIEYEDTRDRRKFTAENRRVYNSLVKSRKELTTLLLKLEKERAALQKKINTNVANIGTFTTVAKLVIKSMPNVKVREEAQKAYLEATKIDLSSFATEDPLPSMPFKIEQVLDALYMEKDLLAEMSEEVGETVVEITAYNNNKNLLSQYNIMKKNVTNLIASVEKNIKRISELSKNKDNEGNLLLARQELDSLEEALTEIDMAIAEEQVRFAALDLFNNAAAETFPAKMQEMITAIENLDFQSIKPTVKKKEEEPTETKEPTEEEVDKDNDNILGLFGLKKKAKEVIKKVKEVITPKETKKTEKTEKKPTETVVTEETTGSFEVIDDTTKGKGMERVPANKKPGFLAIFSATEKAFAKRVDKLKESAKNNDTDVINLIIAFMGRDHLMANHNISEVVSTRMKQLKGRANQVILDYFGKEPVTPAVTEKPEKKAHKPTKEATSEPGDTSTSKTGESVSNRNIEGSVSESEEKELYDIIGKINDTDISEEIKAVIEETKASIRKRKVNALRAAAEKMKLIASDAITEEGLIKEGGKIHVRKQDGTSQEARVEMFLESPESGLNALVQLNDGSYIITSIMNISKFSKSAGAHNMTAEESYMAFSDKNKNRDTNKHNAVDIPVVSEGKPTTRVNPETDALEGVTDAFAKYMNEPRDKSNDKVTFSFSMSKLGGKTRVKALAAQMKASDPAKYGAMSISSIANTLPLTAEEQKTVAVASTFEKLKRGQTVSDEELDTLIDMIPISLRVERSDKSGSAGSYLRTATEGSKDAFENFGRGVREKVIRTWIKNGAKVDNSINGRYNIIEGVEAKWSHVSQGFLNIDVTAAKNGYNTITDLEGVTLDNMEVYAIQGTTGGPRAFNKNGQAVPVNFSTKDKEGMVVLMVKSNTGADFPLYLEMKTLKDTKELGLVMQVLEEVISDGNSFKSPISSRVENLLSEIPLLEAAFKGKPTNEALYKTILFSGEPNSQLRVEVYPSSNSFKIGNTVFTKDDFVGKKKLIEDTLGYKLQRTGFTQREEGVEALTVSSNEYLKYLVESKALSTAVSTKGPIFVGVNVAGSRYTSGISAYLSPASVKSSKKIGAVIAPGAALKLKVKKVDMAKLTEEEIREVNDIFKRTKFRKTGRAELTTFVNKVNDKAGDSEIKACE